MISLLVSLLILGLICYLIYYVIGLMPLPQPVKNVVLIIFGILVILYLFQMLFGVGTLGLGSINLNRY